ncbi:MAG: hypothetical protein FWB85_04925 [Chitinispirillia bacterium]|nr:hypothetical protein [Chitinispirillia bacterium]
MQSPAFTSRPQKHSHRGGYSPPGIGDVRFGGTRVRQNTTSTAQRDGATRLTSHCRNVDTSIEPHLMEFEDDPWGIARKVLERGKVLYPKG